MKNLASEGNKKAKKVIKIAEDYDRTLSAILIGNNIVNIASASIGTVIFTTYFGNANGPWISTLAMTVIVLIFGEITPKSLAKENAESFSLAVVNVLDIVIKILSPIVYIFVKIKDLFGGNKGNSHPTVTEQELKHIIEESEIEGVLEEQEVELVKSALDFDETTVYEVLTPRVDVVAIDINENPENIKNLFFNEGYSRLPVYNTNIDSIIGVIHNKDFFKLYLEDKNVDINKIIQKTVYVPPKKRISELMQELQKLKSHMAIVTEQYGGTIGVITLEDIIEQLVGDIWDESDVEVIDIIKISDTEYNVSADMNIEDFFDEIDFDYKESEINELPQTFASWALEIFERIPEAGDNFNYRNLNIKVLEVSEQRILKMKITILNNIIEDNDDDE